MTLKVLLPSILCASVASLHLAVGLLSERWHRRCDQENTIVFDEIGRRQRRARECNSEGARGQVIARADLDFLFKVITVTTGRTKNSLETNRKLEVLGVWEEGR